MPVEPPSRVLQAPTHSLWLVPTEHKVDLYVREDEFRAARYPQRCSMDLQLSAWDDGQVMVTVLLARLAAVDSATFDRRINVADPLGLRLVQLLAIQPGIDLYMVSDRVLRSFRRPNILLDKAADIITRMRGRAPWSEAQFDNRLRDLDRLYPTSASLWWAIKQRA